MSLIRRRVRSFSASATLVAFSAWLTGLSGLSSAQPLQLPLGLATGSGEGEISDDGTQWATLTPVSIPVFASTIIRTGKGLAWVPLHDGIQQLELHECGVVGVYGSRATTAVKIAVGRVLFRLPVSSETVLATPTVQFQVTSSTAVKRSAILKVGAVSPNSADRVGWITVDLQGNSRIELLQGKIIARPVNGGGSQAVEAGQTADFRAKNGKEADPDFKTLRDKKSSCVPALPAWVAAIPVAVGTAGISGLTAGAVGAGVAGVAGVVAAVSTGGEPSPPPIASPSTP
jgi:hypothetical protein